jgi:effector-binding domain-containing protein
MEDSFPQWLVPQQPQRRKNMEYTCTLNEQAPQPTLTIHRHAKAQDLPRTMGEAYEAIARYLGELGEEPVGSPFCAYYNDDVKDLDVEIGFTVNKKLAGKGEIQSGEVPQGMTASCVFTGPYVEMSSAYEALAAWIEENGLEPSGVSYEFYLNDPAEVPPEELKTEIVFPLKST